MPQAFFNEVSQECHVDHVDILWMGGVALNRLKILISTFHDWSKKTKITTGRIFLRLRYVCVEK